MGSSKSASQDKDRELPFQNMEHIRVRRAKALGIYQNQAPIGWTEAPVVKEKPIVIESKKASKKETKKSKTSKKLKKQKK